MEFEEKTSKNALFSKGFKKRLNIEHESKKRLKHYLATTHAVKHIFNGGSVITRGFWGLLFFGMLIGCLYNVVNSIVIFAKIPVATIVYTKEVEKLIFPAVTICNLNGYNVTYLEENDLTGIISEAIFPENLTEQCAAYVPPSYLINSTTLFETLTEAGQSFENLVADCYFLGQECNNSWFTNYYTPTGNCFTFNGKNEDRLTVQGGGVRHDLELVLNVEQDIFHGSVDSEVGVLVTIHEQDTAALVWESGIYIPVGHSAYLAVTHEHIEDRTNREYTGANGRECIHEHEAKKFEVFRSFKYSYRACRGERIVKKILDNCTCLWTVSEDLDNSTYRLCNITDICCLYNVYKYPTDSEKCPFLCNRASYKVVPSYATFPSNRAMKKIAKKYRVSEETLKSNFLKVHVFFESLSITKEITERSSSLTQLVAYIGGNMGLFLGANIITIVEFLALVFDQIKSRLFCCHSCSMKKITHYKKQKLNEHDYSMKEMTECSIVSHVFNTGYEDFEGDNHMRRTSCSKE